MKEFSDALEKLGVECKLVKDSDYSRGFPNKNFKDWFFGNSEFKKLIKEFSPDANFVDKQSHFGAAAIDANIPLFNKIGTGVGAIVALFTKEGFDAKLDVLKEIRI